MPDQATVAVTAAPAATAPDPVDTAPVALPIPIPARLGAVRRVAVAALRPADSPRLTGLDRGHVRALAELGDTLPPIIVNGTTMRVVDGMHRLAAATLNGCQEISVRFYDGTDDEAFVVAVAANSRHGLPLTLSDRRSAAERILQAYPQLSNRAIAATVHLAPNTVAAIRQRTTEHSDRLRARLGRDGRVRPVDSSQRRLAAGAVIAQRPDASLREIASRAGISLGTARDVRQRIRAGKDPLPERPRKAAQPPAPVRATAAEAGRSLAPAVDPQDVLAGLRSDPSLRYKESGRSLLRWLSARAIAPGEWRDLVASIPPHCAALVSQMAYACAASWAELAQELAKATDDGD